MTKTRKIDPEIVQTMMKQAKVYQSRQEIGGKVRRNCAFVGYDSKGTPRYCALRGPSADSSFRQDMENSDKTYGFLMEGKSNRVYEFEAPIDAMSHATLYKLRGYVEKGLSIEGSREDIDFIARIIRQEITAVYHVDEIKAIADHDTDRLAKMLMKIGKINGAIFFLLIKVLMNLANEGSEDDFDQMLSEAVKLGVDYMQKKDFQINSFLQDTANLRELAEKL